MAPVACDVVCGCAEVGWCGQVGGWLICCHVVGLVAMTGWWVLVGGWDDGVGGDSGSPVCLVSPREVPPQGSGNRGLACAGVVA